MVAKILFCLNKKPSLASYPTFSRVFCIGQNIQKPMTSLLRCEERGRETLRENCFFPEKFIAIPLRHFSIPLTFPQSIQPTICVLEFRGKLPTLYSTFCHLHSTICSGDSGETGGCSVAGSRLTWSVQVVLLESVLKGSMAEEHCASTYPQIQHPGHRRDHCHSLKRT